MPRRYVVLTNANLLTFKDNSDFSTPTEVIPMSSCSTVKSSDEEINKPNSFVSHHANNLQNRSSKLKGSLFTCTQKITERKKVGLAHSVRQ